MCKKGFILIELLIVLVVIAIGFMTVTPLMVERTTGEAAEVEFFNGLLRKTAIDAKDLGRALPIRGVRGTSAVYLHDGETKRIPNVSAVSASKINDVVQPGLDYVIMVYPNMTCDYFVLEISDKLSIESIPILLQTRLK